MSNSVGERLDYLCQRTTKPHVLNALHACRPNHPLGHNNDYKWRNAYALVKQNTMDFLSTDLTWLQDQAECEEFGEDGAARVSN